MNFNYGKKPLMDWRKAILTSTIGNCLCSQKLFVVRLVFDRNCEAVDNITKHFRLLNFNFH